MTQLPASNHPIAINTSLSKYCKLIFMLSSNPPFSANVCLHSSSKCTFFSSPCERKNYSSVLHLEVWGDISVALVVLKDYLTCALVALKDNFSVTDAATGHE